MSAPSAGAPAIRTENLGKSYRLPPHNRPFWPLRGVSFEVQPGEVVGVIGRNGAGKSTLLKLLARITEPSEGRARVNGRVGSLLEVGTGFHPELTGRENIALSAALLGLRRAEIARRFDEIVAFAEIEPFLETPVKRYSSGMYVRLAFAVAAHLSAEILLIDEVLAVGDLSFQRKCLGKIGDAARSGRTALFVSHSMDSIGALCGRVMWLENGQIAASGPAAEVIRAYLARLFPLPGHAPVDFPLRTDHFHLRQITARGAFPGDPALPLGPFVLETDILPLDAVPDLSLHIGLVNEAGRLLFGFDSVDFGAIAAGPVAGSVRFTLTLPVCPLPPGVYALDVWAKCYGRGWYEQFLPRPTFSVAAAPVYGARPYDPRWHGLALARAGMTATLLKTEG